MDLVVGGELLPSIFTLFSNYRVPPMVPNSVLDTKVITANNPLF